MGDAGDMDMSRDDEGSSSRGAVLAVPEKDGRRLTILILSTMDGAKTLLPCSGIKVDILQGHIGEVPRVHHRLDEPERSSTSR